MEDAASKIATAERDAILEDQLDSVMNYPLQRDNRFLNGYLNGETLSQTIEL